MLDLARPEHDGVVVEAFGSGNLPPGAVPAIRRWLDEAKPVVLASRCPFGEVTPFYAFDGGGARTRGDGGDPGGGAHAVAGADGADDRAVCRRALRAAMSVPARLDDPRRGSRDRPYARGRAGTRRGAWAARCGRTARRPPYRLSISPPPPRPEDVRKLFRRTAAVGMQVRHRRRARPEPGTARSHHLPAGRLDRRPSCGGGVRSVAGGGPRPPRLHHQCDRLPSAPRGVARSLRGRRRSRASSRARGGRPGRAVSGGLPAHSPGGPLRRAVRLRDRPRDMGGGPRRGTRSGAAVRGASARRVAQGTSHGAGSRGVGAPLDRGGRRQRVAPRAARIREAGGPSRRPRGAARPGAAHGSVHLRPGGRAEPTQGEQRRKRTGERDRAPGPRRLRETPRRRSGDGWRRSAMPPTICSRCTSSGTGPRPPGRPPCVRRVIAGTRSRGRQLAIDGRDVQALGASGPRVGDVLSQLLDRVLTDPHSTPARPCSRWPGRSSDPLSLRPGRRGGQSGGGDGRRPEPAARAERDRGLPCVRRGLHAFGGGPRHAAGGHGRRARGGGLRAGGLPRRSPGPARAHAPLPLRRRDAPDQPCPPAFRR